MNREAERKRLVKILKENCHCINEDCEKCSSNGICFTHREADHLLDNGIGVKPDCETCEIVYLAIENAKSEAYREFAEKLKENTLEVDVSYGYGKEHYTGVVAVVEIDNTLKKLTRNLHGTCTETTDQTATSVSLIDGHIEK